MCINPIVTAIGGEYRWTWTGSGGVSVPDGSTLSKHLITTAAGSGTLKVSIWKNGQEISLRLDRSDDCGQACP